MARHQKKDFLASRRRVEDDADEEGGPNAGDLSDDSFSEGSINSDEDDAQEGDEARTNGTVSPVQLKTNGNGQKQGTVSTGKSATDNTGTLQTPHTLGTSDMDMMLNGLKISDQKEAGDELEYKDLQQDDEIRSPAVVKSSAQMDQPQEAPHERRRREHEEYKKKRDEDPAFVPNRGTFFMHDHRHSGPAANGFRPFGRGQGRGRGGIGGPFAPANQVPQNLEPTEAPWTHDMHEVISEPSPRGYQSHNYANGTQHTYSRVPVSTSQVPAPNRALSVTKHIGNVQIRVSLWTMDKPHVFPGVPIKQYTRLPDHRPPLRRDKPVRISLPDHPPRYIFPAVDRSFIFIPRALRPNQQGFGGRGRGRSGLGSIGGYSRRTSVFGGSIYGSAYSPSVAMSRRSSVTREVNRDALLSPAGSTMSRPQLPMDSSKPVVKLPPMIQSIAPQKPQQNENILPTDAAQVKSSIVGLPRPQTYPLPQKPTFRENRPNAIPMHQPRPQKSVSVADIESPATLSFNPPQQHQQPFHQQVPIHVNGNSYSHDSMLHSRNASLPSQASTGTPLSQIPERAIHAQPFQPYQQQQQNYYPHSYQVMPPQHGYYYPQAYSSSLGLPGAAPAFVPQQHQAAQAFSQPSEQPDDAANTASVPNLVAQEVNGMVYYYDAAQIPAVASFPTYQPPPSYPMQQLGGVVGMGGMMTPSPDGFYYPAPPQGAVYYSQ